MREPLILTDGDDVQIFASKAHVERYLESPDISSYRAFDSNGMELTLSADSAASSKRWFSIIPVERVHVGEGKLSEDSERFLGDVLHGFLTRRGLVNEGMDVQEMIAELVEKFGFQR